ncbi:hypothetical protein Poli38472_013337 [Pythium oligandrum]|uniref:Uncharacterized protein n=1 Tax=Pythium oligandrum TaxID=41045 RepID=A0A8K1C7W0_PYTOL|nr:hypothetical protein Poli38472_013337 [Pythium oligandrum]|eukprot:TMW57863.1 hypothetical protein Poli38472_013337 [Pythium oligandrum]
MNADEELVERLNFISEFSCAVTFLLQITIIGYDLNMKIRFRTVRVLTRVSQLLTIIDLIEIVRALLSIFFPTLVHEEIAELFPTVCENVTLGAIFVFRLYYVVISSGWPDLWMNRKLEVTLYLLFALHEIPFLILENASGLSWEYAQALWERVTLAGCLYITATNKLRGPGGSRSSDRYKSQEFRRASAQRPSILVVKTASVQRMSASQIVVPAISDRTASCDSIKPSSALAAQVYSKSPGLNSQILE